MTPRACGLRSRHPWRLCREFVTKRGGGTSAACGLRVNASRPSASGWAGPGLTSQPGPAVAAECRRSVHGDGHGHGHPAGDGLGSPDVALLPEEGHPAPLGDTGDRLEPHILFGTELRLRRDDSALTGVLRCARHLPRPQRQPGTDSLHFCWAGSFCYVNAGEGSFGTRGL